MQYDLSVKVPSGNIVVQMNQLCKVCGEPAAGFHFGAFTCEGCKSFFGRTYNNLSSLNECKNNGRCVVNKKNRTSCKACRLRKCLVVGMSKSGSRYGRRSNWFKIHCLMQEQAQSLDSSAAASSASMCPPFAATTVVSRPTDGAGVSPITSGLQMSVSPSSDASQAAATSPVSLAELSDGKTPPPAPVQPLITLPGRMAAYTSALSPHLLYDKPTAAAATAAFLSPLAAAAAASVGLPFSPFANALQSSAYASLFPSAAYQQHIQQQQQQQQHKLLFAPTYLPAQLTELYQQQQQQQHKAATAAAAAVAAAASLNSQQLNKPHTLQEPCRIRQVPFNSARLSPLAETTVSVASPTAAFDLHHFHHHHHQQQQPMDLSARPLVITPTTDRHDTDSVASEAASYCSREDDHDALSTCSSPSTAAAATGLATSSMMGDVRSAGVVEVPLDLTART